MSADETPVQCKYALMIAAFRDLGETVKKQQARIVELEEELEQMVPKGWEGLLTILNEVYPPSIFGGADDDWEDQTRDLGPRLTTLAHHLAAEREKLAQAEAEVDKWKFIAFQYSAFAASHLYMPTIDTMLSRWAERGGEK
jgi:hypothetical protein